MGLLATDIQAKVRYDTQTNTIRVLQPLTRNETQALRDTLTLPEDRAAVETYWQDEREVGTVPKQLDEYAKPFRVPQMAIRDGQRLLRFEPIELDEFDWDLDACDPKFEEADFSAKLHVGDRVVLDVTGQGVVRVGGVEQVIARQTTFLQQDENWDKLELVRTLHKELHRGGKYTGLLPAESQAWLNRVVDYLIAQRGLEIPLLVRKRHELADLVLDRITAHGRKQIRKAAELLFGGETQRRLETTLEMPFEVAEQKYAPYRRHKDTFSFRNHAFELMGEMGQEESHCAKKIDDHPNVKRWVRNLENESAGGYSLPLAPGNFFPDFLAELKDGRNAIIEYKNKKLNEAASEQHKRDVGKLWAARSNGECVFVWVVEKDWATLEIALNSVEV
jgi:type III restriction enzyme